jgi:hypothetical protein
LLIHFHGREGEASCAGRTITVEEEKFIMMTYCESAKYDDSLSLAVPGGRRVEKYFSEFRETEK